MSKDDKLIFYTCGKCNKQFFKFCNSAPRKNGALCIKCLLETTNKNK